MKSANKIRGVYSELKKVFADKFEDHHLYSVSIRLIDLFEKLNKPLKTSKKDLAFRLTVVDIYLISLYINCCKMMNTLFSLKNMIKTIRQLVTTLMSI